MHDLLQLQSLFLETSLALGDKVREQLRAVKVDVDVQKKTLFFWFYYDGEIADTDSSRLNLVTESVLSGVIFDLPPPYSVVKNIIRLDCPRQLPEDGGYYVYLRDESSLSGLTTKPLDLDYSLYFNTDLSEGENLQLLSIYALLGRVRPNLRAFFTNINELKNETYFSFFFDGEISEEDKNIATMVVKDVMTYFFPEYSAQTRVERVDYPNIVPAIGFAIFSRDESIYQDDESYQAYYPKEWFNLNTQLPVVYKQQVDTHGFLLLIIRRYLMGKIRANWRSIQISINQFKRLATLWIHVEGEITDELNEVAEGLKNIAFDTRYTAVINVIVHDLPLSIPTFGRFIFLRDESTFGMPQYIDSIHSKWEKLCTLISSEVHKLWGSAIPDKTPYLRAVKFDVLDGERNVFMLFIFAGAYTTDDESKARELIQKVTSLCYPGYTHQGYIARYDAKDSIPTFGRTVYVLREEKIEDESVRILFYESVADALLGKIRQPLRCVKVGIDELKKTTYFWFYCDREVEDSDRSRANYIARLSSPKGYTNVVEVVFLPYPNRIPSIGRYAYLRFDL